MVADVVTLLALMRGESDPQKAELIYQDLEWSASKLPPEVRARALIHAAAVIEAKSRSEDITLSVYHELDMWPISGAARDVDVAIVTIKPPELDAVKASFSIPFDKRPDHDRRGAAFFEFEIDRDVRTPLRAVITKSGESGNNRMAAFLQTVFASYSVRLCCLVGMAAGHEAEVGVGDVVFGDRVVDFGRRIVTLQGPEIDETPLLPDLAIRRDAGNFTPHREGWHAAARDAIRFGQTQDERIELPADFDVEKYTPLYYRKTVLAGDDLVEDGSIASRAELSPTPARRVGAIEMEGAGFAAACEEHAVPWLVMRGIADFGEPARIKDWQFISTCAAATALRLWLQTGLFRLNRPITDAG